MRGFTDLAVLLELFVSFLVVGGVEKDRLQGIQGLEQARQLRNGYSGSVRDAQSSNPNDLGRILGEIEQRGLQKEVDHAVDALLTMNIVTKELQVVSLGCGAGTLRKFRVLGWGITPYSNCSTPYSNPHEGLLVYGGIGTFWLSYHVPDIGCT